MLKRKLIVVTGKGGAGKTTISSALGLLAASQGLRTVVVEVGDQHRLPGLFGRPHDTQAGVELELTDRLWSTSIDPDGALLEWLQALGGRVSARVLGSSSTFQYFTAAAPGAKEIVSMVKIWELTQPKRRKGMKGYDLVIVDAPATGHALAMLHSPVTFAAIARVGPIASQAQRVRDLLEDPKRSSYLAVTQPTEMAVTETLELEDNLRSQLSRELQTVVVNGTLPRRFSDKELQQIAGLNSGEAVVQSSVRAACAVHDRARFQHNQIARLRRRRFAVLAVPFLFRAELELSGTQAIADHLEKKL